MFDPRDFSILDLPLNGITPGVIHLDIHNKLMQRYFTFRRQNDFYFKWYSNYLEQVSLNRRSEIKKFYKFKALHETMESR
jgi:hypothetical protein